MLISLWVVYFIIGPMRVFRCGRVQLLETVLLTVNQWSVVKLVFALVEQRQAQGLLATSLAVSDSAGVVCLNFLHGVWLFTTGEGTLGQVCQCWAILTGRCTLRYGLRIAHTWHNVFLLMRTHIMLHLGLVGDPAHIKSFEGVWLWCDSLRLGRRHLIRWLRQVSQLETDLLQELLGVLGYRWDQLPDQVKIVDNRLILDISRGDDLKSERS